MACRGCKGRWQGGAACLTGPGPGAIATSDDGARIGAGPCAVPRAPRRTGTPEGPEALT
ncbi:hypothetical protein Lokhon_02710 [Limimaricola hongkongensis DSM 17492]|uniref:Uncharacterized protein n=1 Tax=Limimaricola hongkongensis DSM 17492 TaxID=1122180 RepID=A0A017H9V2_9RHOB|nr:hypothetical protein Lokhon_02710 [Limimaricola hongkongensis DSM 17492]